MEHLLVGKGADAHLNEKAIEPEKLVLVEDLRRDLLGRSDEVRAERTALGLEFLTSWWGPAALAPDLRHHIGVRAVRIVGRLIRIVPDKAVRVDAHAQLRRVVARAPAGFSVEIDERHEAARLTADDREGERQAEPARADHRLG